MADCRVNITRTDEEKREEYVNLKMNKYNVDKTFRKHTVHRYRKLKDMQQTRPHLYRLYVLLLVVLALFIFAPLMKLEGVELLTLLSVLLFVCLIIYISSRFGYY